jgi:sugar phosphate isomerase/epimerase
MIKLAFSTLGCPDWTLARVLDQAGRLGYGGVELRFLEGDDALWERPELRGAGLEETRARLADAGLALPCVDSRSFFHHPDPGARHQALDDAKRALELAAALGSSGIRVFGDRVQPGADLATTRGWVAEALVALRDAARGSGVEIWLESHGDFAPADELLAVLDLAGHQGVGVLWDPANAYTEFGEGPEGAGARLGRAIRHVHLKDARRPAGAAAGEFTPWTPTLVGEGDVPVAPTLAWLQARGGDRWVSLEWEKRWHPQIEEPEVALPHFVRWAANELRGARG